MHTELNSIAAKLETAELHRRIARAPHTQDLLPRSIPKMLLRLIGTRPSERVASSQPVVCGVSPADLVR
jgi:hypothetical protein